MVQATVFRRAVLTTLVLAMVAMLPIAVAQPAAADSAPDADYVIHISVDGLRPDAVTTLGAADLPNLYRMRDEGIITGNARTDYNYTVTLPNHASQLTGRSVLGTNGHGMTSNSDNGQTIAFDSIFNVVDTAGQTTSMYASKTKFAVYERSWSSAIDTSVIDTNSGNLTDDFVTDMQSAPYNYSFVHFADPDGAGHSSGWMSNNYLNSVRDVDGYLGQIFDLVDNSPTLSGNTAIILSADHGGSGTGHGSSGSAANYTIPLYVWGPEVLAGGDLYTANPSVRTNPGTGRPNNSASPQPIRSADIANLAADFLDLPSVTGSVFNFAQDLAVAAASADCTTAPTITTNAATLEGNTAGGYSGAIPGASVTATPTSCVSSFDNDASFPLTVGVHDVTWIATYEMGGTQTVSASQSVTVTDTASPVVSVPDDITVGTPDGNPVVVSFSASASDIVDGALIASCSPPSGSAFALGDTTVTCSAVDTAGNGDNDSFTVSVVESARPVIQGVHDFLEAYEAADRDAQKAVDKARKELAKVLTNALWTAEGAPGAKGDKIFKGLEKAVKELVKINGPDSAVATQQASTLADQARFLAATEIDTAILAGGDPEKIAKAQQALADGDSKDALDKAVKFYGKAFKEARRSYQ